MTCEFGKREAAGLPLSPPTPGRHWGGKFRIDFNCKDQGDLGGKTFAFVSDFHTFPCSSPALATPHRSPRSPRPPTAGLGGGARSRSEPRRPAWPTAFLGLDPLPVVSGPEHTLPHCAQAGWPEARLTTTTYFLNPTIYVFGLVA